MTATPRYSALNMPVDEMPVVRLTDAARGVEVSIATSVGNRAYEMKANGKNILYFPFDSVAGLKGDRGLNGIPFLAPWANRMAGGGFHAGGRRYLFNSETGALRLDAHGLPIHGMLTASDRWAVTDIGCDTQSAWVTSRLEFWKYPDFMANWPFAHEYEMTYRLADGELEVRLSILNRSAEAMPVAIGFHPYFQLPGVPRKEAVARVPADEHVETDERLVATGEFPANTLPETISLGEHKLDDGFTSLRREPDGSVSFSVEGNGRRIEVIYGPNYQVAVVYAPPGHEYICFEPMTAVTNGVNLAHEGKYPDLQLVAAGQTWSESFRVRGFGI